MMYLWLRLLDPTALTNMWSFERTVMEAVVNTHSSVRPGRSYLCSCRGYL